MNPFCKNKKGYLLPMVIIYMVIAMIVGAGIMVLGSMDRIEANKRLHREQAFYLAEAGIDYARYKNYINLPPTTTVNYGTWTGKFLLSSTGTDPILVTSTGLANNDTEIIQLTISAGSPYPDQPLPRIPTANDSPTCVWVTPDGLYAYVSHWDGGNGNTVDVIQTSTNTIIKTIHVEDGPGGIAVTPNGNYVYVTNWDTDHVSVIRTSDNTVRTTINVGNGPYNLAVTPNGNYVYVTNYGTSSSAGKTVSVIRTSDNKVTKTINVGNRPQGIAVNPDGTYVYVTNYGGDTVSVIRTSDNKVTKTINVGTDPISVDVTLDGDYAYVANYGENTVDVIRTSDNTVTKTINVGTEPTSVKVTPDGLYAYVTNWGSNNISVIRLSDNTVMQPSINVETLPNDLAFTPLVNGTYTVYITNYGSSSLSVIGGSGGQGSGTTQWTKLNWKIE